jgi:hypothetical protein
MFGALYPINIVSKVVSFDGLISFARRLGFSPFLSRLDLPLQTLHVMIHVHQPKQTPIDEN